MGLREARQRDSRLRHLHERVEGLLHTCSAARGETHEGLAVLDAVIHAALETLADHRAHGAAEELKLERTGNDRQLEERAREHDERI